MTEFYLDTSALFPLFNEELSSSAVEAFVTAHADDLVISDFTAMEMPSAFSLLIRTGRLDQSEVAVRLANFDLWRTSAGASVELEPADLRLGDAYVRRFDLMLKAPDALHAAICSRRGWTLVTFDRRLAAAAQELGLRIVTPA